MPRRPKAKDGLTAGERAALYEAAMEAKRMRMSGVSADDSQTEASETFGEPEPIRRAAAAKAARELPKPEKAVIKADLSLNDGKIGAFHGMCNGPMSHGADISHVFKEIGVPFVCFSGTDTEMSAYAVDVSRIFKRADADPNDGSNYDFSLTDRYVAAAYNVGAKVIYRLGESSAESTIRLLEDAETAAQVCANIVRHYNDSWANGYAYGIEYFEILDLCEAESVKHEWLEAYRKIAVAVKLADASVKVGGSSFLVGNPGLRELISFCTRKHAPLDFVSLSVFECTPERAVGAVKSLLPTVRNSAFPNAEIIISRWGYIDRDAAAIGLRRILNDKGGEACRRRAELFGAQKSIKGAAYSLAFMLMLNSVEGVSAACMYDAQPALSPWCAITDFFGEPTKTFYAFKAYGELYRAGFKSYCVCEQDQRFSSTGVYAVSATSEDGKGYILISSFGGCGIVDLRLEGISDSVYNADVYLLDGVKNFELGSSLPISGANKRLILHLSEYGAALIKLN